MTDGNCEQFHIPKTSIANMQDIQSCIVVWLQRIQMHLRISRLCLRHGNQLNCNGLQALTVDMNRSLLSSSLVCHHNRIQCTYQLVLCPHSMLQVINALSDCFYMPVMTNFAELYLFNLIQCRANVHGATLFFLQCIVD